MDGAGSPPASAEEEPSGGPVDLESRPPAAAAMIVPEKDKDETGRGYVDSLLRVSLQLLRNDFVPEVRRQGLNLMLHLLCFRWDELHVEEWSRSTLSDYADLMDELYDTTDTLPSKSDLAALITDASLSGGICSLNGLVSSIIFLSKRGLVEAELAAFILKSVSDSRIDCGVDPDGGQFEVTLSGLDEVLPNILLTLSSLLEKYGGIVLAKQPNQLIISSCLFAANAYAKWVPVVHLDNYGLIERCKNLLDSRDLRVLTLQFFRVICQRRRPLCATEDYDKSMNLVFWILMSISQDSLTELKSHKGFPGGKQLCFAGRICECLVALASLNMQFIMRDGARATHFFQQMLEYYQHSKFALHFRSLQFWLMVLKELSKEAFVSSDPGVVASAVNPAPVTNSTEKGSSGSMFFVSDDILTGIMDVSLKRIPKKSAAITPELLELWNDELHGKSGFVEYRSLLLDVIRFITYKRPAIAIRRAVLRINCIIGDANAISKHPKDLAAIESAQLGLETIVNAIFDDSVKIVLDTEFPLLGICKIFEGLLMQLLSLNWTDPRLVVTLGHYLDALCPFLTHFPASVAMVVSRLLELLPSVSVDCHDPSEAQKARLQICSYVICICQAVDGTYLPSDMKDFFSVTHITEEDLLAFVAINRTAYSVEQKHGGEGNQDVGARLRPWALSGETSGLSVALHSFHDLSTRQPSFVSRSAPSSLESSVIARTLNPKKFGHHHVLGSVPNSLLRLGAKSHSRNEGTSLNRPAYQMDTENCCSGSLASASSICLALIKQRQQLPANVELLTHVSHSMQVGEGILGTVSSNPEKNQLLLIEHYILSETFIAMGSCPRIQDRKHLLTDLLQILNKIWTQPDWKYICYTYQVARLFDDNQFTRIVHSLVTSFEKELTENRVIESAGAEGCFSAPALDLCMLPKLMLSLVLRVLNCIQTFWKEPISYDVSGVITEDIRALLENGKQPRIAEADALKNAGTWLLEIRETGYKVIGLCTYFDRAFYGLLGRSSIINVLMENLRSMEFNHLGKLIVLVIVPLVKNCPRECWDEWMFELLEPIFSYYEDICYYAWFTFLHKDRAEVPAYFGYLKGPKEIVIQFEKEILIKFTRSVCELLQVLSSERLNSGLLLLPFRPKNSMRLIFKT